MVEQLFVVSSLLTAIQWHFSNSELKKRQKAERLAREKAEKEAKKVSDFCSKLQQK